MAERIVIDDGRKTYEIVNLDGDKIGEIHFNPSDANMVSKYNEIVDALDAYFEKYRGAAAVEQDDFVEAQKEIVDKFDAFLGGDASKMLFSICGPFTPMEDGELYLQKVIEVIGAVIEKETKKRMKKVDAKMDKYLKDYQKQS